MPKEQFDQFVAELRPYISSDPSSQRIGLPVEKLAITLHLLKYTGSITELPMHLESVVLLYQNPLERFALLSLIIRVPNI